MSAFNSVSISNPRNLCYMCAGLHLFLSINEVYGFLNNEGYVLNYLHEKYGSSIIKMNDFGDQKDIIEQRDVTYGLYNIVTETTTGGGSKSVSQDTVKKFFCTFRYRYNLLTDTKAKYDRDDYGSNSSKATFKGIDKQEDAEEFLRNLFNFIEADWENINIVNTTENLLKIIEEYVNTIVSKDSRIILNNGYIIEKKEIENKYLTDLDFIKNKQGKIINKTLQEMVENCQKVDQAETQSIYYIKKDVTKNFNNKQYVILTLSRFDKTGNIRTPTIKIDNKVEIKEITINGQKYIPSNLIVHSGDVTGGHYVNLHNFNNKNDSSSWNFNGTTTTTSNDFINENTYIILFTRV